MDHGAASEIEHGKTPAQRGIQQAAFAPDHVRHRAINNGRPQDHEDHHGAELHPLGKCACYERRRDDGKHELIDHEGLRRNGCGVIRIRLRAHAMQKKIMKSPDKAVSFAKRQAVPDDCPNHGDHGHQGETLHHGGQHVFFAHQTTIEERQARAGHQQHQRGAHEHPGIVGGAFGVGNLLFQPGDAVALRVRVGGRAGLRQQDNWRA